MKRNKYRPRSIKFTGSLYYHNAMATTKLVTWIHNNQFKARKRYPLYFPSNKDNIEQKSDIEQTNFELKSAKSFQTKQENRIIRNPLHTSRVNFVKSNPINYQPKILIISSCTKRKSSKPPLEAMFHSFEDLTRRDKIVNYYQQYKIKAKRLYKGSQHDMVRRAISRLSKFAEVKHKILSAGFGLIDPDKKIIPYDCTFKNKTEDEFKAMVEFLQIEESIRDIRWDFDMVFLIMSDIYLKTLDIEYIRDKLDGELIYFNFDRMGYKINQFLKFQKQDKLDYVLGRKYHIRGQILMNFVKWVEKTGINYFADYWHSLVECSCNL